MTSEADVFGKLSRIFETHNLKSDQGLEIILDELNDEVNERLVTNSKFSPRKSPLGSKGFSRSWKPTPYEVWHEKQEKQLEFTKQLKPIPTLTVDQWDRLVSKMHQSNRQKQSAMINEQNKGLAQELGGYLFKPRINKTSLDLSATMKSLSVRMPEMLEERKKELEQKRKENAEAEMAQCTFAPKRDGVKMSDAYLKRIGRTTLEPQQHIDYGIEKQQRIEVRRKIVQEIEERELTFKPQVGKKSQKLQEKLIAKGIVNVDPVTRTTIPSSETGFRQTNSFRNTSPLQSYQQNCLEEGPMLVIESEHPYRNNTNEFTTVHVPGAVKYTISFHADTRTEAIYDFVKFYADETHTEYFGAGKYSGGTNQSACNWPGLDNRPPLIICSPKFVIHFKTNGAVNDWGFRMHIVPTLLLHSHADRDPDDVQNLSLASLEGVSVTNPSIPVISPAAKHYKPKEPVHRRLYHHALHKQSHEHNQMVDYLQTKLNIPLKPWETARPVLSPTGDSRDLAAHTYIKMYSKTHHPKAPLSEYVASLLLSDADVQWLQSQVAETRRRRQELRQSERNRRQPADYEEEENEQLHYADEEDEEDVAVVFPAKAPFLAVVEFDDSLGGLWRQLRLN